MDIGIFSMNTEYTVPPHELAPECEARGLESLWLPEHTHIPAVREGMHESQLERLDSAHNSSPEEETEDGELPEEFLHFADPFIGLAAAAAVTTTLKLGTAISIVTQHDPIVLAKTIATLDQISKGRVIFGIGAGWLKEEMLNHGVPPKRRWTVLTEKVEAMKQIWTQEEATYHGEFVNFDRIISYPKPVTKPYPPIILGCWKYPVALKRVVDLCDGWFPEGDFLPEMDSGIADLHDMARAAGRDPSSIPISSMFLTPPDKAELERFEALGGVRAVVRAPTEGLDAMLPFLDEYAKLAEQMA